MYKEPYYFEEGKVGMKNKKMTFFSAIIILITIGILVLTATLAYKMIKGETNDENALAMNGEKTIGKTAQNDPNVYSESPKVSETPNSQSPEPSETIPVKKTEIKFPAHDINAAMESQLPQYSDEIAQKVIDVYFDESKKVYLTFDDGPSGRTPEVLDILDKYNVKATFFVLGVNVDNNPEIVKRIYESGHFIANHGYSHKYSAIYTSPQAVLDEYNQTLNAVRNAIGNSNYNPHLFRFPGGSSGGPYNDVKQAAIGLLRENEITYTNWNCLTGDAAGSTTVDEMWAALNESAAGDDNLVILMHDAADKHATVEFLPQLIEKYQKEGYEFCTYYDIMKE